MALQYLNYIIYNISSYSGPLPLHPSAPLTSPPPCILTPLSKRDGADHPMLTQTMQERQTQVRARPARVAGRLRETEGILEGWITHAALAPRLLARRDSQIFHTELRTSSANP